MNGMERMSQMSSTVSALAVALHPPFSMFEAGHVRGKDEPDQDAVVFLEEVFYLLN